MREISSRYLHKGKLKVSCIQQTNNLILYSKIIIPPIQNNILTSKNWSKIFDNFTKSRN